MEADFSGYATKAGLKCTDGRTIMPDAFKHQDKMTVPLVWQHGHTDPNNVLGHAVLENRSDGVYAYGYFNETQTGQSAKLLVQHKDIQYLSIWANQLVERSRQVFHGAIREVSLVLAGANPGAKIDFVQVAHSDGDIETLADEAVITTGLEIMHADSAGSAEGQQNSDEKVEHADGTTVEDVYNSLTDEQKNVVHYMIGAALEAAANNAEHGDNPNDGDVKNNNDKEGSDTMKHNVFETAGDSTAPVKERHYVSHDDMKSMLDKVKGGAKFKQVVEEYALAHGINDIETLFPDAKAISATPEFDKRRTEWVSGVINGATKRPFSRIKSFSADITEDEARAKGYIKGNFKKEEFFSVAKRVTTPTTVYKKQKLDRDDLVDITDFDVVAWLKMEMRLMMDEELARAALIGDGRSGADDDKIKDPVGANEGAGIRSIANDHELYAATVNVNLTDANSTYSELIDTVLSTRRLYKGSGNPTLYTTETVLTKMLLLRDGVGRRLYRTVADLASELRVENVVPVEVMEAEPTIVGVLVNMVDFTFGADRGGELTMFDDFDIDYNQYKWLLETRVSGALTKLRSAIVYRTTATANVLVDPQDPARAGNTITVPTQTGVVYKNADTSATLTTGAPVTLTAGQTLNVKATPAAGYYFENNIEDEWSYTYDA